MKTSLLPLLAVSLLPVSSFALDQTVTGKMTLNPATGQPTLELIGPTAPGAQHGLPGLTNTYQDGEIGGTVWKMFREHGLWQWQTAGPGNTDSLRLELNDSGAFTIFDPVNPTNRIILRAGSDANSGVFYNNQRLLTASDATSQFLPTQPLSLAVGIGAVLRTSSNLPNQGTFAAGRSARATGLESISLGSSSVASGSYSFAAGVQAEASGNFSVSVGLYSQAQGTLGALALGSYARASGTNASSLGANAYAQGNYATALGSSGYASGNYSTMLGTGSAYGAKSTAIAWGTAAGEVSTAIGGYTGGIGSTALHGGTAYGNYSFAAGNETSAFGKFQTVLGRRSFIGGGSPDSDPTDNDFLFVLGNGHGSEYTYEYYINPVYDQDGNYLGDESIFYPVTTDHFSNAIEVKWSGDTKFSGSLTVEGGTGSIYAPTPTSVFKKDVSVQGVLRVKPAGDLSMGSFTTGPLP